MCGTMGEYTDVVSLPLNGRVRTIDRCIHQIVAALNAGGVETTACCCGHGKQWGDITLEDGRTLIILPPLEPGAVWCESSHRKAAEAAWEAYEAAERDRRGGGR
jgi:hypothetical protein